MITAAIGGELGRLRQANSIILTAGEKDNFRRFLSLATNSTRLLNLSKREDKPQRLKANDNIYVHFSNQYIEQNEALFSYKLTTAIETSLDLALETEAILIEKRFENLLTWWPKHWPLLQRRY